MYAAPARPLPVLIVDDCRDTADSFAMLLRLSGYDVRTAYDGTQALAQINGWQPAAVLMDIMLPGCSGIELRERICREAVNRPRLIAVTGLGTRDDLEQVKAAGFDHVLLKPVDPDDLLAVLRASCRFAQLCRVG
jgi:two-component system, OmpR family, response regulator